MQISEKTKKKWAGLKERNDVKKLASILEMEPETVSRILNGKQETTTDVLLKMAKFFNKKAALTKRIEQ